MQVPDPGALALLSLGVIRWPAAAAEAGPADIVQIVQFDPEPGLAVLLRPSPFLHAPYPNPPIQAGSPHVPSRPWGGGPLSARTP